MTNQRFKKEEDKVDIALLDMNEIGVFDSGKNLKVYVNKEKSDLLAIVYGYNHPTQNYQISFIKSNPQKYPKTFLKKKVRGNN